MCTGSRARQARLIMQKLSHPRSAVPRHSRISAVIAILTPRLWTRRLFRIKPVPLATWAWWLASQISDFLPLRCDPARSVRRMRLFNRLDTRMEGYLSTSRGSLHNMAYAGDYENHVEGATAYSVQDGVLPTPHSSYDKLNRRM